MTITRFGMTPEAIEELVNRRVEEALDAHEATHTANALETENQSQNGSKGDNGNGGNGMVEMEMVEMRIHMRMLEGTEGVVGLIRWFEKMETMFHISNCPENSQVKYATCTLLDNALTWWNSHKRTIGTEEMEIELWNLTVKNNDLIAYTQRFQELTMMCTKMVPEEEDRNTGGQNLARAYVAGNNEKKEYEGTLPFCNKCKLLHVGPCTIRCGKCNKIGHLTQDCKVTNSTTSTQRGQMVNQRDVTCFQCGAPGHFWKDCPKKFRIKYTLSALLDITPSALDVSYAVELDLGSFDVIIGMDWLAQNHAVIVCDEKIVRIPYGNEILIVQGDKSDKEKKSTLSIISGMKAQKYMEKGCQLFLAQVMVKETEDMSKEKRLKDVPIVRDFPKVFLKDLPGLPPT
ncbi:putative reverse transcriptase domain-containing protein [Tanacetum coccineum]